MSLKEIVKELVEKHKKTHKELAKGTGYSTKQVQRILSGETKMTTDFADSVIKMIGGKMKIYFDEPLIVD